MAIFAKTTLTTSLPVNDNTIESISIVLLPNFVITFIYVPPNCSDAYHSSLLLFLQNLISKCSSNGTYTHLIAGDFYAPRH